MAPPFRHAACKKYEISSPRPLTWSNTTQTSLLVYQTLFWQIYCIAFFIEYFLARRVLLSHASLASHMRGQTLPFWSYVKLWHFLGFPNLLYTILFSDNQSNTSRARQKWEQDLWLDLSEDEWDRIFTYLHKGTVNVSVQEIGFNVISSWYRTP